MLVIIMMVQRTMATWLYKDIRYLLRIVVLNAREGFFVRTNTRVVVPCSSYHNVHAA